MKIKLLFTCTCVITLATSSRAEQGGSAHYMPDTYGVGPVLSYVRQIGKTQLLAEIKWLPELETDLRMEGDYIWFKFGFLF